MFIAYFMCVCLSKCTPTTLSECRNFSKSQCLSYAFFYFFEFLCLCKENDNIFTQQRYFFHEQCIQIDFCTLPKLFLIVELYGKIYRYRDGNCGNSNRRLKIPISFHSQSQSEFRRFLMDFKWLKIWNCHPR